MPDLRRHDVNGGTGNNQTAANQVFFLGLPWTPSLCDVQRRLVVVAISRVENSIDPQPW